VRLSNTLKCINLGGVDIGLVPLCDSGPMHLCSCVSEKRGDGEGAVRTRHEIHLDTSNSPVEP